MWKKEAILYRVDIVTARETETVCVCVCRTDDNDMVHNWAPGCSGQMLAAAMILTRITYDKRLRDSISVCMAYVARVSARVIIESTSEKHTRLSFMCWAEHTHAIACSYG